jgi:cytidylate kinase
MTNTLIHYLNNRLEQKKQTSFKKRQLGPVITISREVGCNGIVLAKLLASELKKKYNTNWNVLSKEIFYKSAHELELHPEIIKKTMKSSEKSAFDHILKAFNDKKYKSDQKIAKTVRDVIRTFAEEGHNIIVGRASHIIAKNINNALHLRLIAPLDYRTKNIMHNNKLNETEAKAFIEKVENERKAFRKALKAVELNDDHFDLSINRASFSPEQAVELILFALEEKIEGFEK